MHPSSAHRALSSLRIAALLLVLPGALSGQAGTGEGGPAGAAPPGTPAPDTVMMREVREAFLHAWRGYMDHAAGYDDLRPISATGSNWYETSLLMTPVDAYDTMLLMGLDEEAEEAKTLIFEGLDWDLDMEVQVFEIVIRHLGGLLAAYQMDGDPRWRELAVDLADRLMPAFDSPTGMPYRYVNLRTGATRDPLNNPAEIGTLLLELGTVTELTGDGRYLEAVTRAMRAVHERRSPLGLVGEVIDVRTGEWTNPSSHVGGRIDSWYEYLLKGWLLFGDGEWKRMYDEGMAAVNRHVADERFEGLWYGRVHMDTGERLATTFGALEAFMPAMLALGGDLERAARLQDNVARMWLLHGIEPEGIDYATMEVASPGYILRPEAIESAYYLFRITGEERWREMGKGMFRAVVRRTRTPHGFAHIRDVRTMELADAMQSFFLAETLKYAWLLAAPAETLDFHAVVFNTEAHPLRRP